MPYADPEARRAYNRHYREANKERLTAYIKDWREKHRDELSEKQRQRRQENLAEIRAKERAYGEAHREARAARAKKWREDNPDRLRAGWKVVNHRKRARLLKAHVEDVDARVLFERDNWTCQICGEPTEGKHPNPRSPSIDHIVALANGGEHSYANTQCAHLKCNVDKRAVDFGWAC
jgi:5-methylcytosine-specific restriction endonuclease McrA